MRISNALEEIQFHRLHQTDGQWLEALTARFAPMIADWDIREAWSWMEWPERSTYYPETPDIGIDVVAQRRSDDRFIAIQCKSRKLNAHGRGADITKKEFDSFLAVSGDDRWAERWLVVNGDVRLSSNADKTVGQKRVTLVNIETDLRTQLDADRAGVSMVPEQEGCRTRDAMQTEAITKSVRRLRAQAQAHETGRARGRIILPCGTGKSRIALRIIEELTEPGQISAVLCPSIALVSQLRREFLTHGKTDIAALAVCSDDGVVRERDLATDPTADLGQTVASEVKGLVTTQVDAIIAWMDTVKAEKDRIGIIFGTYQSSHRIADALDDCDRHIQVMIADEAHRTAGLRRIAKLDEKLRDFTVCHDDDRFPATYRVYQTATPKVYNPAGKARQTRTDDWVVRDMADAEVFGVELHRESYAEAVANRWLTDYRIIAIGVNDEDAYQTANQLAENSRSTKLSTAHFLRGLVLALLMGGVLRSKGVDIRSSINFMNLTATSEEMADTLRSSPIFNKNSLNTVGFWYFSDAQKIFIY